MPEITADELLDAQLVSDARRSPKVQIGKLADLLDRSGIAIEDVARVNRINAWQGMMKGDDGEAQVIDLVGIQLVPSWADGPEWPVVQPAKPVTIRHRAPRAHKTDAKLTMILPDPQIGFWRLHDGDLLPIHDEAAMACALSLIEIIRPQRIVNLGDFLDLAEWSSKFAVLPEFVHVTQPTLDRGHQFLAEQIAAAGPDVEVDLLGGNHDDRLGKLIMANAKAALRLRPACSPPDTWPSLSIPALLRLDDLGVTYTGAYPAGRIKLAEAHGRQTPLYALHGERLDMRKQAEAERQSTIQGHAHHFGVHTKTYELDGRPVEVESWSCGCLCRADGFVPSTKGAADDRGMPANRVESWQHAVALLTETETGWDIEPIRIRDGRAMFRGREVVAT